MVTPRSSSLLVGGISQVMLLTKNKQRRSLTPTIAGILLSRSRLYRADSIASKEDNVSSDVTDAYGCITL
jgi:hypothetical protein